MAAGGAGLRARAVRRWKSPRGRVHRRWPERGASSAASVRGCSWRRAGAIAADPELHPLPQPLGCGKPGGRGRPHLRLESGPEFLHPQGYGAAGLGNEIHRPEAERLQRGVGAHRSRRHHDDGAGPLNHYPVETLQSIHLWHLHVEGDDVGAKVSSCDSASSPLRATRISKSASSASTPPNSFRISAESSTTSTLITHPSALAGLELIQQPPFRAGQQLHRVEQQHHAAGGGEIDDATHEPERLVRELRCRLDRIRAGAQHIGYAIDDDAGAVTLGLPRSAVALPCLQGVMSNRRRWSMTGRTSPRKLTTPSRNFGVLGSRVIWSGTRATSTTASIGRPYSSSPRRKTRKISSPGSPALRAPHMHLARARRRSISASHRPERVAAPKEWRSAAARPRRGKPSGS